jgi:hypothetical protein
MKSSINADSVFDGGLKSATIERLILDGMHWKGTAVEFFDATDRVNTLVQKYERYMYKREINLRGNLLILEDGESGKELFLIKESPVSNVQLEYPGSDFGLVRGSARVLGTGVTGRDLNDLTWTRVYNAAIGMPETPGKLGILTAIRALQKTKKPYIQERDEMIMLNTWGDMSKDTRLDEAFCMKELEAAAKIGVSHFQLDDGWQTGRSGNSAFKGGTFNNIWSMTNYWSPDSVRFPNGLQKVIERGRELGIEIGLWFHSSRDNSNANWENDANVLIGLYKKYGIRTYKIDGVDLPDKTAEINFRKFLDKVRAETDNNVVFNLDVTAGRRGGYFYFTEYGNLFLENRFTDWHDYYPYTTLRNLWMLSEFVPPQLLQVEFLNNTRNTQLYEGDPFAPSASSFEYNFAITMPSQPLAWFEASNLPESIIASAGPVLKKYRQIQSDLHQGDILPIGSEPNGRSWTGFQSIQTNTGYFIVFRERNPSSSCTLQTWLPEGSSVTCTPVIGQGKAFKAKAGKNGSLKFSLPAENSWVLYQYTLK